MEIVVLDAETIGKDINYDCLSKAGNVTIYNSTSDNEIEERVKKADVLIINKIVINETILNYAKNLKLICITATGYDKIDTNLCKKYGIGVCNVENYSTESVAQVTIALALSLWINMQSYSKYIRSGEYSESGNANKLEPAFRNINGKTWGIVGYGNIGKRVSDIAKALGCKTIVYNRTKYDTDTFVDLETLCKNSDIISLHLPHNEDTHNLISEKMISEMKKGCILINTARGAITDEEAIAKAIEENRIAGFASDVFSIEPFSVTHPFYKIKDMDNVIFTPHIGWASVDSRQKVIEEIVENILSFQEGKRRCRVE